MFMSCFPPVCRTWIASGTGRTDAQGKYTREKTGQWREGGKERNGERQRQRQRELGRERENEREMEGAREGGREGGRERAREGASERGRGGEGGEGGEKEREIGWQAGRQAGRQAGSLPHRARKGARARERGGEITLRCWRWRLPHQELRPVCTPSEPAQTQTGLDLAAQAKSRTPVHFPHTAQSMAKETSSGASWT